jgi:tetratricopeptide (TPR) repeat protein
LGRYDEAITAYRKALDLDPNFAQAHQEIGDIYEKRGMFKEAIAEWHTAKTLEGSNDLAAILERTYLKAGFPAAKQAVAQKIIEQLHQRAKQEYVSPVEFAFAYIDLGNKDEAIKWLEKAYEQRNWWMPFLRFVPKFESLRGDPRFVDLLDRIAHASKNA